MEQRTCNIIMCCKGNCKIDNDTTLLGSVVSYMSQECGCKKEIYDDCLVERIMREALFDYFKCADNPSFELRIILHEYPTQNPSLSERIAILFRLAQVKDNNGYVNGFTEELLKQSEIDLSKKEE